MISPWTVDACLAALAVRPDDGRIREALCMTAGDDCHVCGGRALFSDCEACGIDIPPFRDVFAVRPTSPFLSRGT